VTAAFDAAERRGLEPLIPLRGHPLSKRGDYQLSHLSNVCNYIIQFLFWCYTQLTQVRHRRTKLRSIIPMQFRLQWVYNRPNMSIRTKALIALVVASILWASSGTVAKMLFSDIDPVPLITLRLAVATIILLPLFFIRKHPPVRLLLIDTFPVALAAAGNFFFFTVGVSKTTANASAIIYTITPLLTLFLAKAAIQEYTNTRKLIGIIIGLLGVITILLLPMLTHKQSFNGDVVGNLIVLCAVVSWTYYIVGSRKLTIQKHYEPLIITTVAIIISFIFMAMLTFVMPHRPILPVLLSGTHPYLLLYYGVAVTVATFFLHQWAIKHSSATTGSLTNYMQPVFAFAYNAIFVGEILTPEFLFGSLLVLVGVFIATSETTNAYFHSFREKRRAK
jgi:drug/metabolite transporter (DMT)-like permease